MNELLPRTSCFNARDYESCQDLTLPERLWWRRASEAITSRNLEEAFNVVQESRAGRYIRGFVLDGELALLDEQISRMLGRHLGGSFTAASSSAMLSLEYSEGEKLKLQMLMEKRLLEHCTETKPSFKNTFQKQSSEDNIKDISTAPRCIPHDKDETSEACPVVPQKSMAPRCVKPEVSDANTAETPCPVVPQISMSTRCITPELNDGKIPEKTFSVVSQISLSLTNSTQELTFCQTALDIESQTSIVTPITPRKKMGFRKRIRSVFSKIGRVIGSGCCCGRRQAEE